MKKTLVLLSVLLAGPLHAAGKIAIDPAQRAALDIRVESPQPVVSTWGMPFPAKVVVPNAQLRVVSALRAGLLEALLVAEGEEIVKGQPLAVIQSPQLLEQQRDYLAALTRLELSNAALKRDRQLHDEGIIAERRYLETRANNIQIKTRVEQHRQLLQLAGLGVDDLKILARERRLSSTLKIRSPMDAVVLDQLATPGQQVDALEPIYKVGQLSPLWLEIHVPLDKLGRSANGSLVEVDEPEVKGRIITVGRMVHEKDQGILVRAQVDEGAELLRPGQFVQVRIAQAEEAGSFRIPRAALVRSAGKTWVFLVVADGFSPTQVQIRSEERDYLIISGKLNSGDKLAISGTAALKSAWLENE